MLNALYPKGKLEYIPKATGPTYSSKRLTLRCNSWREDRRKEFMPQQYLKIQEQHRKPESA